MDTPQQGSGHGKAVDAEKPFDSSAKADVILRSSDSIDFFVLKPILSIASPILDDMFSLDRGESKEKNLAVTKNGLPIVELEEDSETLSNLLHLIYPYGEEPSDLDVCGKVAGAARKYVMDGIVQRLRRIIMACEGMEEEPIKVLTIGIHFGWEEIIKEAAMNTLSTPLRDLLCTQYDGFRTITAADLNDLFRWRFACQDALVALFKSWRQETSIAWATMSGCLEERLAETGCPHNRSLMTVDDSVLAKAMQRFPTSQRHGPNRLPIYEEILSTRRAMMVEIEDEISIVPFKIKDIWIIPEPASE